MLKGLWLKEAGFDIGDYISVTCEDGKITITQDAEGAAVKTAEAEFMVHFHDSGFRYFEAGSSGMLY